MAKRRHEFPLPNCTFPPIRGQSHSQCAGLRRPCFPVQFKNGACGRRVFGGAQPPAAHPQRIMFRGLWVPRPCTPPPQKKVSKSLECPIPTRSLFISHVCPPISIRRTLTHAADGARPPNFPRKTSKPHETELPPCLLLRERSYGVYTGSKNAKQNTFTTHTLKPFERRRPRAFSNFRPFERTYGFTLSWVCTDLTVER